ncbi:ubiquitin-associated protein 1-like isoform X2 [Corythoichthys intestinalis]|uniref:ubiquitin-associated protein 1-like isoform X2 n=1 Tax=Corythoichthys intestinalis TaxID=161448 RepID=UPI0025A5A6EC|nr:ubiquitin-associated protein 1-like isoform X2 [Corythoichthys intestinalis]
MMNTLEDVPFGTPLGSLGQDIYLMTPPDISVPDCPQIMRETQYAFSLEKLILTGQQPAYQSPSCPPYWLMFSSPNESWRTAHETSDPRGSKLRRRSSSLNSADARRPHRRGLGFRRSDSDEEDGYCEDNEGSSPEDGLFDSAKGRERPRSAAISRVKDGHVGFPSQCRWPEMAAKSHRGTSTSPESSPLRPEQKSTKKRHRAQSATGRLHPQNTPGAGSTRGRLQQQRPSSAGPVIKNCRQNAFRTGGFLDSATELLSALSQEERELLEAVTDRGYPLRSAILALQKTGYNSPDKLLKYLAACNHLCELGYDEAQVEEALEMFQSCRRVFAPPHSVQRDGLPAKCHQRSTACS